MSGTPDDLASRIDRRIRRSVITGDLGEGHRSGSGAPAGGHAVADLFSADEIFRRLSATADEEFRRTPRMLWFSGLAAGVSIGLTFLARMAMGAATDPTGVFPGDLLYPIGFVVVVLGRYQLFTENTLTPVTLVLTRIASLPALLRLWGVVLAANLVGAGGLALLLSAPGLLDEEQIAVGREIAAHAVEVPSGGLFLKAVVAGTIVASMVWLTHSVREGVARILVVYGLMLLIPTADLFHCITGFCEVAFGVVQGEATVLEALRFTAVVVSGNVVGGVLLVATINYGQTVERRFPDRDCSLLQLSWREFFLGHHEGRSAGDVVAPELTPSRRA